MTAPRPCPSCGRIATDASSLGSLDVNHENRHSLAQQSYELHDCSEDGLLYLSPAPSPSDISAMYEERTQFGDGEGYHYRGEQAVSVLEYTTSCLLSIFRFTGWDTGERIRVLEVGAGLGWMCRAAKITNHTNHTVAQDLTSEAVDECRWVDRYVVGPLPGNPAVAAEGPFNLASMTHVIEHLVDPVETLTAIAEQLMPGGIIFVSAPHRPVGWDSQRDLARFKAWSYHHTPAHLQYFSRESFRRTGEAAGLELVAWNDGHEDGQAFEGWLRAPLSSSM